MSATTISIKKDFRILTTKGFIYKFIENNSDYKDSKLETSIKAIISNNNNDATAFLRDYLNILRVIIFLNRYKTINREKTKFLKSKFIKLF
jgi:hypothetical protein